MRNILSVTRMRSKTRIISEKKVRIFYNLCTCSVQFIVFYKQSRWPTRCNNNNLLNFKLAQHISGNSLPILRSARLWFTACGIMAPDCCRSEAWIAAARTVCSVWRTLLERPSHVPETSFTPNTQSVPLQSRPPTDNNLGPLYHML